MFVHHQSTAVAPAAHNVQQPIVKSILNLRIGLHGQPIHRKQQSGLQHEHWNRIEVLEQAQGPSYVGPNGEQSRVETGETANTRLRK